VLGGMNGRNNVPSAPADMLEPKKLFAEDGRKRKDQEFVGARAPDADADTPPPRRRRKKQRQRA
jgi:hypothetical protein